MTRPRPSPIAYLIRIGQATLDHVLVGGPCICKRPNGDHAEGCLIGEAILHDPNIARRARAAKEKNRE